MEYVRKIGEYQNEKFWRASIKLAIGSYSLKHNKFEYEVENFTTGYHNGEYYDKYYDGYDRIHHSSFYFTYITESRENIDDETEEILLEMLKHSLRVDNAMNQRKMDQTTKSCMKNISDNNEILNNTIFRADKIDLFLK